MKKFLFTFLIQFTSLKNGVLIFLRACSSVFFLNNASAGLLIFAATLFRPSVAVLGLLSFIVAETTATLFSIPPTDTVRTILRYNSLLIGFSIGHMFTISALTILLVAGLAILVFLLTFMLQHLFSTYLALPVLNIPFVIAGLAVYLASEHYSSLNTAMLPLATRLDIPLMPFWLSRLLKSVGQIVFIPYDSVGLVIIVGILISSPIMFFLTICSWIEATAVQFILKGSLYQAASDPSSFNFILVGIALGGVFLVPSRKSYSIAALAVAISVIINDAVQAFCMHFQIPSFTLAFNITSLLFIYLLTTLRHPILASFIAATPEESLTNFIVTSRRFDKLTPKPHLPFYGTWSVFQGYNGRWTHVGKWKHAVDFVITDNKGLTYRGNGLSLEDYYCYDKPVIAPVSGTVVDANDSFNDNNIGEVERRNNWGNYCIIRSDFGYYVELSHLKKGSLTCKKGAYITVGTPIGRCGNSGNSPQPHIHIQVQTHPFLGAPTIPFQWGNASSNNSIVIDPETIPEGTHISALVNSKKLTYILQFGLDEVFEYSIYKSGSLKGVLTASVIMDSLGWYGLKDMQSGSILYFGNYASKFIFYSLYGKLSSALRYIFLCAPAIPLFQTNKLCWNEAIPDKLINIRDWRQFPFFRSFSNSTEGLYGVYSFSGEYTITGQIRYRKLIMAETIAVLDKFRGFHSIRCSMPDGVWELKLKGIQT